MSVRKYLPFELVGFFLPPRLILSFEILGITSRYHFYDISISLIYIKFDHYIIIIQKIWQLFAHITWYKICIQLYV